MDRELDPQPTCILCSFSHQIKLKSEVFRKKGNRRSRGGERALPVSLLSMSIHRGLTRPARHSTQHFSISFTTGSSSASVADGSWTGPGASSGAITSPRFATASGEPCLLKSIAPMSVDRYGGHRNAGLFRARKLGFRCDEPVGPSGRVIARRHHFSTTEWMNGNEGEREAKGDGRTTCFHFPLLR
jgi:hypothetical protein